MFFISFYLSQNATRGGAFFCLWSGSGVKDAFPDVAIEIFSGAKRVPQGDSPFPCLKVRDAGTAPLLYESHGDATEVSLPRIQEAQRRFSFLNFKIISRSSSVRTIFFAWFPSK
jgi:hypothetical protein